MPRTSRLSPAALAGVGLLCAAALAPPASGDELLALVPTGNPALSSSARIDQVFPLPATTPYTLLASVAGLPFEVTAAFPTREGTDLLLFGVRSAPGDNRQVYVRVGRRGTAPSSLTGPFETLHDSPVTLLPGTAVPPVVAVIGPGGRLVARVMHEDPVNNRIALHLVSDLDKKTGAGPAPIAGVLPAGWATSVITVAPNLFIERLVAVGETRLLASGHTIDGGGLTTLYWINAQSGAVTPCVISGDPFTLAVSALHAAGSDAVAALSDGTLVGVPASCTSASPLTPQDVFGVSLPGLSALSLDSGGPLVGTSTSASQNLAAVNLGPGPTFSMVGLSTISLGGAVATSGTTALLSGLTTDTGQAAYQLWDGATLSALSPVINTTPASLGSSYAEPRVLVRVPTPTFGVGPTRNVDLTTLPGSQRVQFLDLYGATGTTLQILPGTCTQTSVIDASRDTMGRITIGKRCGAPGECPSGVCTAGQCTPPLVAGAASGSYQLLTPTQVLAIAQGDVGQDCQMILTASGGGAGAGALIRVQGATLRERALALVLDRSGSMLGRVNPAAPPGTPGAEVRREALLNAVHNLVELLAVLPDARDAGRFALIAFNQLSNTSVPADPTSFASGATLQSSWPAIEAALSPSGATNIRGALLTAAQRLGGTGVPATATERSILLLTDGLHNMVGAPQANSGAVSPTPVGDLLNAVGDLAGRINRLYAVGLSDQSQHQTLMDLVSAVNGMTPAGRPAGFLDYSQQGNEVAQFFNKVLWGFLDATEYFDPLVAIDDGGLSRDFLVHPANDRELIVSIAWQDMGRGLVATLRDGETTVARCQQAKLRPSIVCYLQANQLKSSTRVTLRVDKTMQGGGPVQAMIEVAGRSEARLRTFFGKSKYRSGETLLAHALLTEFGLPIRGGTISATLEEPAAALGTVLAQAQIDPAQIDRLIVDQADPPSRASAKLQLMGAPPARRSRMVVLEDTGQNGDQVKDDGIYTVAIPAAVPGRYSLTVRARFVAPFSGQNQEQSREAGLATQVVTSLDVRKSDLQVLRVDPPTKEKAATLQLRITPRDPSGHMLGPGNGGVFIFRQGRQLLSATITEPAGLDGSYTAEVSGIKEGVGPVTLDASGAGVVLFQRPETLWRGEDPGDDGCKCDLGRRGQGGGPLALLALCAAALFVLRRRRSRGA